MHGKSTDGKEGRNLLLIPVIEMIFQNVSYVHIQNCSNPYKNRGQLKCMYLHVVPSAILSNFEVSSSASHSFWSSAAALMISIKKEG